ncbi:MAG: ATP-binding cassette domain-containing protein [Butyrivibrio sp.]|nr:ATP-binding cassette domain-containing protein [Butyrivibrio sp.]
MRYYLETKNLNKQYGTFHAVKDMNVHMVKGDIYGLIGPNGAGKTTLMKMIIGFANPTSGEILIDEKQGGKKIGNLIESPGIYGHLDAFDNMMLKAKALGVYDKKTITEILDFVGLSSAGDKKAGKFSLGMKQRLGIALALLGDPEILILDEPINGLDPQGIIEVRELIIRLNEERNMTIMISSHILGELQKVANVFGIITGGELLMEITSDELKERCSGDSDSLEEFYLDVVRKGRKVC